MADRGRDVVGLVPAAGTAERIRPIPCSKEILPLGFRADGPEGRIRPRAVAEHLLEAIRRGGASRAFVVLRTGKWDIPAFLEEGPAGGPALAYLVTPGTAGVPFTLEAALPFVEGQRVLFGFPDILFEPADALGRLLDRLDEGDELALGLFPAARPEKMDMVELGPGGRVESVVIKPEETDLRHTWILAAWSPGFSEFLGRWCERSRGRGPGRPEEAAARAPAGEPYLGHVVQAAVDEGMEVGSVVFEEGSYVDVGTPRELAATMVELAGEHAPPSEIGNASDSDRRDEQP